MRYQSHFAKLFLTLLLASLACGARAATVTFVLDQSNALPDNVDYLTVTVSDEGGEGWLDFWVDVQSPLEAIAGENFGIQHFNFSIAGAPSGGHEHGWEGNEPPGLAVAREHREYGSSEAHRHEVGHGWGDEGRDGEGRCCRLDSVLTADDFILPDGWQVHLGRGGHDGEAGGFGVHLVGTGYSRQDPLHFSVYGLDLEDVLAGFSAHVAGFEFIAGECGPGEGEREGEHPCRVITSAWFSGERPVVVPVPAALWLFGSGLFALAGFARRGRRS